MYDLKNIGTKEMRLIKFGVIQKYFTNLSVMMTHYRCITICLRSKIYHKIDLIPILCDFTRALALNKCVCATKIVS